MSDIEIAKKNLDGHSICLCKDAQIITDDSKGISPMMKLLADGKDLAGWSVADIIVGKAAAMLFVRAGIKEVYAKVLSETGREMLERHGIAYTFQTLTPRIINRQGTDICPMEKAVADIEDIRQGYEALKSKIEQLKSKG